tara:strand:+ start:363 stop:962 length:600 start_codon:yes stop_codon:yes gene_type:complete
MFTGLIQSLGSISSYDDGKINIETKMNLDDCKIGSSISCNGVCLTITDLIKIDNNYSFSANVSEETEKRTTFKLKEIIRNKIINLEKSLKVGDEIGGHFVYGHIDLTTQIIEINKIDNSWEYKFNKNFLKNSMFVVEKGSITIDGISLTVANVSKDWFTVSVIPQTFFNTNLQYSKVNDLVNIEFDYLTRFIISKNEKN